MAVFHVVSPSTVFIVLSQAMRWQYSVFIRISCSQCIVLGRLEQSAVGLGRCIENQVSYTPSPRMFDCIFVVDPIIPHRTSTLFALPRSRLFSIPLVLPWTSPPDSNRFMFWHKRRGPVVGGGWQPPTQPEDMSFLQWYEWTKEADENKIGPEDEHYYLTNGALAQVV